MLKRSFLLSILLAIVGCATTAKYEEVLNTWIGADVNQLVDSWGYPQNSFEAPNGNKVYTYSSSGQITMPTQTNSNYNIYGNTIYGSTTTTGGQTINLSCTTHFEADPTGRIVKWSYKGNQCKTR
jgi:hypothetical protein